jgi:peptidyl-tRNA hydrolase
MNLSGKAVHWMDKENISLENIFVITDDLNLFRYNPHRLKEAMEATTD